MNANDWVTLAMSSLSLVVAIVGTVLSNRRATEALRASRAAATETLRSEAIEAAMRMVGVDPTGEDLRDPMRTARVRYTALVDKLGDGWPGFDRWLVEEQTLGTALARDVLQKAAASPRRSVEEHLELLKPYAAWGTALTQNLRHFRRTGHDAKALRELSDHAGSAKRQVYARNGWGEPPTEIEGVEPLHG